MPVQYNSRPRHVGPKVLPNFSIFNRLLGYASRMNKVVIRDIAQGYNASHMQLLSDVLHLRNALNRELDPVIVDRISNGDEICFCLLAPGGYEFAVGFLAILAIGGIIVPLSPALPVHEGKYFVEKSQAVIVLTSSQCSKLGDDLSKAISAGSNVTFKSVNIVKHIFTPLLTPSNVIISSDHFLDPLGSGLVIFTSGTTGPPKAAVKRRFFLEGNSQAVADLYQLGPEDVVLHTLPVHHATGIGTTFLPFLISGSTIEFDSTGFQAAKIWKRWREGGLTLFSGVPTMYMRLMAYYETTICDLPQIKFEEFVKAARSIKALLCGTSALPRPLQQKWSVLLNGKRILERYGTTEFSGAFTVQPGDTQCPDGSVGQVMPGLDVRLSPEGEILLKSPYMFAKYLGDTNATAAAFDSDGFFRTGDIARQEGSYFFILGRASIDILKSGGYKISALDIEREILEIDYVSEVMVVGIEDEEFGQRVAAAIVLKNHYSKLTIQTLRHDLRSRLVGYKMPTILRVVSALPKTASGKVTKKVLGEQFFPASGHPDVQMWQSCRSGSKL